MPTNSLRDSVCKAAKPAGKRYKIFDGGDLHLAILPSGAKTWRFAYRLAGKPQTKSFGPYPEVSLADARKKREELRVREADSASRQEIVPLLAIRFSRPQGREQSFREPTEDLRTCPEIPGSVFQMLGGLAPENRGGRLRPGA